MGYKRSLSAMTKGRATRAAKKALLPGYGKKGNGLLHPGKAGSSKLSKITHPGISSLFK